jgi:RNA polymerase sigma factor (sigma-70 family)
VKLELNEQLLLKGLASNDAKAIETIYKQNYNMVQTFVLNNNGTYDEAQDIFQESMIALYEKAKNESFILTCKINTYVYSICRRLWLKRLQQLGRNNRQIEGFEETIFVEDDFEMHQKRDNDFIIMERALGSMGEPCKSLLEGYYLKKLDMVALAKEFGYTNADNAKNQKYKCLVRLKKMFFAQYNIGE